MATTCQPPLSASQASLPQAEHNVVICDQNNAQRPRGRGVEALRQVNLNPRRMSEQENVSVRMHTSHEDSRKTHVFLVVRDDHMAPSCCCARERKEMICPVASSPAPTTRRQGRQRSKTSAFEPRTGEGLEAVTMHDGIPWAVVYTCIACECGTKNLDLYARERREAVARTKGIEKKGARLSGVVGLDFERPQKVAKTGRLLKLRLFGGIVSFESWKLEAIMSSLARDSSASRNRKQEAIDNGVRVLGPEVGWCLTPRDAPSRAPKSEMRWIVYVCVLIRGEELVNAKPHNVSRR